MVYGTEKVRDMTRSLLPSRNREAARNERARIHRSARRLSRVELAQLARDLESFEDLAGLDDDVTARVRQMAWHRRGGDLDATLRVLQAAQRLHGGNPGASAPSP